MPSGSLNIGISSQHPGMFSICSNSVYIWGKLDYNSDPIIQHIAAIGCNSSFELLDINTTFLGTDLNIDLQNLSRALENTARDTTFNCADIANEWPQHEHC